MVRPALAAVRAADILDHIAAHPGAPFTLSELSRALDINLASALSVLRALTDAGYLVRHPSHKTYTLGPSLVALGHAAFRQHPVIGHARPEMVTLAGELSTECVASAVIGDEIVILAAEGRPQLQSADVRVGQRLPLLPPIGQVFLAWSPPREVESWLQRLGADMTAEARAHLLDALSVVRARGYSVSVETPARTRLGAALARLADRPRDARLRAEVADLVAGLGRDYELLRPRARTTYVPASIAAPVFDSGGGVALALTVNGLPAMPGSDVLTHAERLVAAVRLITRQTGGRVPEGPAAGRNVLRAP